MVGVSLACGALASLVGLVLCACRYQRKLVARLARIERLKTLTERLDAHGVSTVRSSTSRVKLV